MHELSVALTIPQTAQKLGVSRSTVYRLINDGVLAAVPVRCVLRVRPKDIERYLDHQQRIQRERLVRL
ncbi:MAG: helix-turn-helix domain-containing protein [Actinomycetales bacterium]|nr:helix-turn-helix domain-containing protein [Actinomycetales bacterium]